MSKIKGKQYQLILEYKIRKKKTTNHQQSHHFRWVKPFENVAMLGITMFWCFFLALRAHKMAFYETFSKYNVISWLAYSPKSHGKAQLLAGLL